MGFFSELKEDLSQTEGVPERTEVFVEQAASDALAAPSDVDDIMVIQGDVSSKGSLDLNAVVNGNIEVLGRLNMAGALKGNVRAAEIVTRHAKITGEVVGEGAVEIGQGSVVIGNITAMSAVIAGAVKGDIDVQGPVVLAASAIVVGNIKSKTVQIMNGAVIEGMCSQCYADINPTSFFDEYKEG